MQEPSYKTEMLCVGVIYISRIERHWWCKKHRNKVLLTEMGKLNRPIFGTVISGMHYFRTSAIHIEC